MSRRRRRSHRRSHSMMGLGEPISLIAIPWLWVAGGALFAKWFSGTAAGGMKDTATDMDMARAQKLRRVLAERMYAQGTLEVGGGISVEQFIAANADLLNPALYADGKAPTAKELANEIVAIVRVAKARQAGAYDAYVRTLQGRI